MPKRKYTKRALAALCVFALTSGLLCGCSAPKSPVAETLIPHSAADAIQEALGISDPTDIDLTGSPYTAAWHADYSYFDCEYEHYEFEWFDEYSDPIYEIAENGASQEEFDEADNDIYYELYYISTMQDLIYLQYSRDTGDEEAAEEYLYAAEVYNKANDKYWSAMHAVAVSKYSDLLKSHYPDWIIDWFKQYDDSDDGGWLVDQYTNESRLIQEYYELIDADEPDYDAICELYIELVELRRGIAEYCGYNNYAEYCYSGNYAREYLPTDSSAIWQATKDYYAPLAAEYSSGIFAASDDAYYSDAIDCSSNAVISALDDCLDKIAPELGAAFDYMLKYSLYDFDALDTKSGSSFTTVFYYLNEPFIFMTPSGTFYDYSDFFHEFGHYANSFYTESDLIFGAPDNDLNELQSQGLELISTNYYEDIFGEEYASAIRDDVLISTVYSVVDGAMYDEFQQRVFDEENLNVQRVYDIFTELYSEYGYEPYDGCEYEWMYVVHNFEYPFYYISYAVSAIPALELFTLSLEDHDSAVEKYLQVDAMDSEVLYFSEALADAGLSDVFGADVHKSLCEKLSTYFDGE